MSSHPPNKTPPPPARAAIAQLTSTSNKVSNLINTAKCAGWGQREGASMLFLPECFGFLGENADRTLDQAEPPVVVGSNSSGGVDDASEESVILHDLLRATVASCAKGETPPETPSTAISPAATIGILEGLRVIAQASGLWISGGGMHVAGAPPAENGSDRPRVYNTHVILNEQGVVQCLYRKIHLFDVHIPGKVQLRESATTAPGTELVVCDSPLGRLGLSTCYDVRFPEQYVPLVHDLGAQILLVPSAFTVPTGHAHWHTLLKARAIEHQCYVLAAAQYGQHNDKRKSYGHSLAVDPWGTVVADAGGCDGPGTTTASPVDDDIGTPSIILCDIDLETLESTRERMPIRQHRDSATFEASPQPINK